MMDALTLRSASRFCRGASVLASELAQDLEESQGHVFVPFDDDMVDIPSVCRHLEPTKPPTQTPTMMMRKGPLTLLMADLCEVRTLSPRDGRWLQKTQASTC